MGAPEGPDLDVVVVAGTDTGVGKTFVSVALARALVARGKRVVAIKPVETGCVERFSAREDGVQLAAATGQSAPVEALLRLVAPLAPAVAAEQEGVEIDLSALVRSIRAFASGVDVVLVEGAGGLLSPLTWKDDITDVARAFGARVLLVAPNRLGVIHHVRSAMRVLESAGLSPLGVVLSTQETEASTSTNAEALRRVLGATCPHIAVLPRTDVTKATITTFGL